VDNCWAREKAMYFECCCARERLVKLCKEETHEIEKGISIECGTDFGGDKDDGKF
jgi:hypothetical protein